MAELLFSLDLTQATIICGLQYHTDREIDWYVVRSGLVGLLFTIARHSELELTEFRVNTPTPRLGSLELGVLAGIAHDSKLKTQNFHSRKQALPDLVREKLKEKKKKTIFSGFLSR